MISPSVYSSSIGSAPALDRPAKPLVTTNPETIYDAGLVRRFNAGDETVFIEIVERHRRSVFSIALNRLRNHADAEEIAQDAFIRAYRGLANFRGESSLASWLYTIVNHLSINRCGYYFRRNRHNTHSFESSFGTDNQAVLRDVIASDAPSPEREESNREFLAHVKENMEKLSTRHREILMLRSILDHSYAEIAELLAISEGTVKSRLARARQCLHAILAETYGVSCSGISKSDSWFESNRPTGRLAVVSC